MFLCLSSKNCNGRFRFLRAQIAQIYTRNVRPLATKHAIVSKLLVRARQNSGNIEIRTRETWVMVPPFHTELPLEWCDFANCNHPVSVKYAYRLRWTLLLCAQQSRLVRNARSHVSHLE